LITVIAAIKGRPAHETLESLRLTLLKIEQSAEPEQDAEALAELKRILLQRIAELEAIQALEIQPVESDNAQTSEKTNPADLVPPESVKVDDSKDTAALASVPTPSVELE
jgi:hypothetical protein